MILFTNRESLDRFLDSHKSHLAFEEVKSRTELANILQSCDNLKSSSGRILSDVLIDPRPDLSNCPSWSIASLLARVRETRRVKPLIDVLRLYPELTDLGQERLQALGDSWLQTPVAKECGISRVTFGDDFGIGFEVELAHAIEHGEEIHFPLDNLLISIVDSGIEADQRDAIKKRIRSARASAGPLVYQRFTLNLKSQGSQRPLFLICKTAGCNNLMHTQFSAYKHERIRGGPFTARCPQCNTEHEYLDSELHFRDL